MVLTDSTSKHTPAPGYEKLSFIAPEEVVRPELEHISSWDFVARDSARASTCTTTTISSGRASS